MKPGLECRGVVLGPGWACGKDELNLAIRRGNRGTIRGVEREWEREQNESGAARLHFAESKQVRENDKANEFLAVVATRIFPAVRPPDSIPWLQ